MNSTAKLRVEFGDFQTPLNLAEEVCSRLKRLGFTPDVIIEPTCGKGAFILAAAKAFPDCSHILGFEVNQRYVDYSVEIIAGLPSRERIQLEQSDFFTTDWKAKLNTISGSILVLGNLPWVTNSGQGLIGGENLPKKSNFHGHDGFDAISGKSNFDISEWMLLDILRWFEKRPGDIAMLVKTAVARKVMAYAERCKIPVREAVIMRIDAKKHFDASVDACLFAIRVLPKSSSPSLSEYDYSICDQLDSDVSKRVGHRGGITVGNLQAFERCSFLVGQSPQKWRSGVKHDASEVMEFTRTPNGLLNGMGEVVDIEPDHLYPLLKGSDIGSGKDWRQKYVLLTQRCVGEPTGVIRHRAPLTWEYLERHSRQLDARASSIYLKNPRFSIFGIGDYTFKPWKIAICGLYKKLLFRLVGPINERPVVFDDTVYFISFETKKEAADVLDKITAQSSLELLSSLIFWDEKRPVKTSILNRLDWSRLDPDASDLLL